jgi:hypothetical protein
MRVPRLTQNSPQVVFVFPRTSEYGGDQEAGKGEEYVDSHPAYVEAVVVQQEDHEDGHASQSVQGEIALHGSFQQLFRKRRRVAIETLPVHRAACGASRAHCKPGRPRGTGPQARKRSVPKSHVCYHGAIEGFRMYRSWHPLCCGYRPSRVSSGR